MKFHCFETCSNITTIIYLEVSEISCTTGVFTCIAFRARVAWSTMAGV